MSSFHSEDAKNQQFSRPYQLLISGFKSVNKSKLKHSSSESIHRRPLYQVQVDKIDRVYQKERVYSNVLPTSFERACVVLCALVVICSTKIWLFVGDQLDLTRCVSKGFIGEASIGRPWKEQNTSALENGLLGTLCSQYEIRVSHKHFTFQCWCSLVRESIWPKWGKKYVRPTAYNRGDNYIRPATKNWTTSKWNNTVSLYHCTRNLGTLTLPSSSFTKGHPKKGIGCTIWQRVCRTRVALLVSPLYSCKFNAPSDQQAFTWEAKQANHHRERQVSSRTLIHPRRADFPVCCKREEVGVFESAAERAS